MKESEIRRDERAKCRKALVDGATDQDGTFHHAVTCPWAIIDCMEPIRSTNKIIPWPIDIKTAIGIDDAAQIYARACLDDTDADARHRVNRVFRDTVDVMLSELVAAIHAKNLAPSKVALQIIDTRVGTELSRRYYSKIIRCTNCGEKFLVRFSCGDKVDVWHIRCVRCGSRSANDFSVCWQDEFKVIEHADEVLQGQVNAQV